MRRYTITGRLSCHRDGYGFVVPDEGGDDVFVPARYLRENLHGDRVTARVEAGGKHGKREGRIIETLERGVRTLVGRFETAGAAGFVIPDEPRITCDIAIPAADRGKARTGEVVIVELTSYPSAGRDATGRIIEVLGRPDDPDVEILAIVRKYGLADSFPDEVLKEAHAVALPIDDDARKGRIDLRGNVTVTIDGETARDFDDAVAVREEGDGEIRLWVSVADVSHYVRRASSLDREALSRGTSVYFPNQCLPMLPEELSNGICSLNPGEERLAVTAELLFDRDGLPRQTRLYPSVIRSCERLTYTAVKEILVDGDPEMLSRYRPLTADLRIMERLALRLREVRRQRGSIDFDLPEPEIVLDLTGRPESVGIAERNLAHRIIEEFMLAANEAVAAFLAEQGVPCLYRVHELPDPVKLKDFREFIKSFGLSFRMKGDTVSPGELQRLLARVAGRPEEKMVNEILLRCMKQARYSPDNIGHFGLASPRYLHFTSPIRRYPDLVVHRILKDVLGGGLSERNNREPADDLPEIAEQASRCERTAMEAEREIVDLKRLQYMEGRIGDVFDGYITGVTSYGFFVELADLLVEGLVHVSALDDDFYRLLEKEHTLLGERRGRKYCVGDRVRIRVDGVNRGRKRIEFSLAEGQRKERKRASTGAEAVPFRPSAVRSRRGKGKGPGPGRRKR